MVSGDLSALLMDWTSAVTEFNTLSAHSLLEKEPELLWTPIAHSLDDTDHLQDQLAHLNKLGTSFQPVSAIQFTLLQYRDTGGSEEDQFQFLSYLIEHSSLHDLDTRFWGECNNSTLHLVCFLGFGRILKILIEKGVSVTPSNDLGFLPKDVTMSESILQMLSSASKPNKKKEVLRTKSLRPNYSTPDRFKLLRELAEESSGLDHKKSITATRTSEGHYFRKGRVKETQKKVLEEDLLSRSGSKRQLEVAQLAKKSAVKNNPLWKKMEKRSFTSPTPSPSNSTSIVSNEPENIPPVPVLEEHIPKRNSKVILSLQTKSYVSSSIFVQADEESVFIPPIPTIALETPQDDTVETPQEDTLETAQDVAMETAQEVPLETPQDDVFCVTVDPDSSGNETQNNQPIGLELIQKEEDLFQNEEDLFQKEEDEVSHKEEKEISQKEKEVSHKEEIDVSQKEEEDVYNKEEEDVYNKEEEDVYYKEEEDVYYKEEEYIYYKEEDDLFQKEENSFHKEEDDIFHKENDNFHKENELLSTDEEEDCYFEAVTETIATQGTSLEEEEIKHDMQTSSDEYSEDDNEYEEATPVQFATRLMSPIYKSVVIMNEESPVQPKQDTNLYLTNKIPEQEERNSLVVDVEIEKYTMKSSHEDLSQLSTTPEQDEVLFNFVEPSSPPVRPQRSDLRRGSSNSTTSSSFSPPTHSYNVESSTRVEKPNVRDEINVVKSPVVHAIETKKEPSPVLEEVKDKKRMSGSQKAAWTMSMSSWAAILDREFNLDELQKQQLLQSQLQSATEEKDKVSKPKVSDVPHTVRSAETTSPANSNTPRQSTNTRQMNNTGATRHSTATIDYIGSGKLELSDEEMDTMMLRHGYHSTTAVDNVSSMRSSSLISLSFNDFEIPAIPLPTTHQEQQKVVIKSSKTPLPPPSTRSHPLTELPRLNTSNLVVSRKPIVASSSETSMTKKNLSRPQKKVNAAIPAINLEKKSSKHGKLYLHVNGIQDILLPLPKDRAYVRCVVSDGRFEYMSRYEILTQNINFDYECVIDTHPDMIITLSLHVRPDYVMKSRTPFSRLFSSKKKKESLSGYVNKEDGAIGQARFALAHMLPACIETTYLAGFHCFNAWYSRSFKERHRQKKKDPDQDVLKVVGNFDVEMLYLPITDFQKPFPRNLRECDIAIKQLQRSVEESSEKYLTY